MSRRGDVLALLALAALSIGFFWKLALTNLILVGVDIFTYFYPYRSAVNSALTSGRLPLWNPYLFMGVPLLANGQAGVFYPLNWPFVALSAPAAINASIVLHVVLMAACFYLFARDALRLEAYGALVAACVFVLGGYAGSLVEHVNQLQAAAWLPLLLWCVDRALRGSRLRFALLGGLAFALQLLAGHVQVSYITLMALGVWLLVRVWQRVPFDLRRSTAWLRELVRAAWPLAALCVIGVALSAVQILPMLELSRLSIRGGGMSFREAVAFSLPLNKLPVALLPTYGLGEPVFSEYVAFVGVLALALALWGVWRQGRRHAALLWLLLIGLALALGFLNPLYFVFYKLLPGFGLFRVPARWLLLYALAIAAFAGFGAQSLLVRFGSRRALSALTLALLVGELFIATRWLPYNQPTAPEAFDFLRPSIAYLRAQPPAQPYRVLSYSDLSWDPGDLGDMRQIFAGQLSPEAIYQYVVAVKAKEIIAPNLPLHFQIQSVDGYDGGILPLKSFVGLQSLFLTPEQVNPDGRLRERLRAVPDARWLDLFNVRYLIADKIFDVWVDGIYYDLGLGLALAPHDRDAREIDVPNDFTATALGVISYLEGGATLPNDTPVAELIATDTRGQTYRFVLRAGRETAESEPATAAHAIARAVHTRRGQPNANEYHARFNFPAPVPLSALRVRALQPAGMFHLRGLSLIDAASSTGAALTFAQTGRFRVVQSGDIKLYEYLDAAPRAQVLHRASLVADDGEALAQMRAATFDPRAQVLLAAGQPLQSDAPATTAHIRVYEPERIVVQSDDPVAGYLLLKDTWYPGWRAWVDGAPVVIERADTYFRAVYLSGGAHTIEFRFEPAALQIGALISGAAGAAWLSAAVWLLRRKKVDERSGDGV